MKTSTGSPLQLGARICDGGVNFALYSKYAQRVKLVLFEQREDTVPSREIDLNPVEYRTGDIWHLFLAGLGEGQLYGYRVRGPQGTDKGYRFKPKSLLLDPYARAVADIQGTPKSVVVSDHFDWQGVPRPKTPLRDSIIYETHIRGFTVHPSSTVSSPGTYRGVIEKIGYLQDLGITAVEFLPVHEFNENEKYRKNPLTGELLRNYWGYSTISFFAPKGNYSASGDCGQQVTEFREMVRELHRAGIEVILDVVFNHTAEMNQLGPLYNFRGIDNRSYYLLQKNKRLYQNLTGCGNTFFCNHPAAATLIVDCLKYWYSEMGVDGFRFDLATVFNRDKEGAWLEDSPIIKWIENEPALSGAKLISEAWDAAGGYAVGRFGSSRWCDWNDKYRDDVRRYWRNDGNQAGGFATRISGSQDLFQGKGSPLKSINYVACHDGFTMRDLVSCKKKHNRGNAENNRDGKSANQSMNFGVEGDTDDPVIRRNRIKQVKNFFTTLMLSQGVPMILGGDEFFRTQKGNNNAYCQDNEISWYDWDLIDDNRELHRFVKNLIRLRKKYPSLRRHSFYAGGTANPDSALPDITWLSSTAVNRKWDTRDNKLACIISGNKTNTSGKKDCPDLYLLFNPTDKTAKFSLFSQGLRRWRKIIDTSREAPFDIRLNNGGDEIESTIMIELQPKSLIVLRGLES